MKFLKMEFIKVMASLLIASMRKKWEPVMISLMRNYALLAKSGIW
jgi:hypothetical protein